MIARVRHEEERDIALDVIEQLKTINTASLTILEEARNAREPDLALKAVDRIHKQIELQAKLLGELDERSHVNLYLSPEWLELRALIVSAIEPYAAARESVLRALEGSGNGRA